MAHNDLIVTLNGTVQGLGTNYTADLATLQTITQGHSSGLGNLTTTVDALLADFTAHASNASIHEAHPHFDLSGTWTNDNPSSSTVWTFTAATDPNYEYIATTISGSHTVDVKQHDDLLIFHGTNQVYTLISDGTLSDTNKRTWTKV